MPSGSSARSGDAAAAGAEKGLSERAGMILENMVAQMLKSSGHALYFHEYLYKPEGAEREKKYEIDFMTVKKKKICPIEVKSSGYRSHKSFDYLVKKYQMKMEDRYIIYTKGGHII